MQTIVAAPDRDITNSLKSLTRGQCGYLPGLGQDTPYYLSEPVSLDGVSLVCDVDAHVIYRGPHDGTTHGVPCVDVKNTSGGYNIVVRNLFIGGPVNSPALGQRQASVDGLRLSHKAKVYGCRVNGFDCGFVYASPFGHVDLTDCGGGGNFYGMYCQEATGGPGLERCSLVGNAMAGVGLAALRGVDTSVWRSCEFGYAPFAVYQEGFGGPITVDACFMNNVTMQDCSFESVGNGAVVSDGLGWDGPGQHRVVLNGLMMNNCSGSWGDKYRLAGRSRDFAFAGDVLSGKGLAIVSAANSIGAGAKGLIGFAKYYAKPSLDGAVQSSPTVRAATSAGVTLAQLQAAK